MISSRSSFNRSSYRCKMLAVREDRGTMGEVGFGALILSTTYRRRLRILLCNRLGFVKVQRHAHRKGASSGQ